MTMMSPRNRERGGKSQPPTSPFKPVQKNEQATRAEKREMRQSTPKKIPSKKTRDTEGWTREQIKVDLRQALCFTMKQTNEDMKQLKAKRASEGKTFTYVPIRYCNDSLSMRTECIKCAFNCN